MYVTLLVLLLWSHRNIHSTRSQSTHADSLLDVIALCKCRLVVSDVKHIDMHEISDLIYCDLNVEHEKPAPSYKTFRDFKNVSIEQFQNDQCRTDWRDFYGSRDVESIVSCLNNIILQLFDIQHQK